MVIKTDLCFFSEMKVYPGHGIRYVRKDGRLLTFLNRKVFSLSHFQRKKSQRLRWTVAWRRKFKDYRKKVVKKKSRKTVKSVRAVGGLSVDAIKQRIRAKIPKRTLKRKGGKADKKRK